jgi:hypothetical protein
MGHAGFPMGKQVMSTLSVVGPVVDIEEMRCASITSRALPNCPFNLRRTAVCYFFGHGRRAWDEGRVRARAFGDLRFE